MLVFETFHLKPYGLLHALRTGLLSSGLEARAVRAPGAGERGLSTQDWCLCCCVVPSARFQAAGRISRELELHWPQPLLVSKQRSSAASVVEDGVFCAKEKKGISRHGLPTAKLGWAVTAVSRARCAPACGGEHNGGNLRTASVCGRGEL